MDNHDAVLLPKGVFRTSDVLRMRSNTSLVGLSQTHSVIAPMSQGFRSSTDPNLFVELVSAMARANTHNTHAPSLPPYTQRQTHIPSLPTHTHTETDTHTFTPYTHTHTLVHTHSHSYTHTHTHTHSHSHSYSLTHSHTLQGR